MITTVTAGCFQPAREDKRFCELTTFLSHMALVYRDELTEFCGARTRIHRMLSMGVVPCVLDPATSGPKLLIELRGASSGAQPTCWRNPMRTVNGLLIYAGTIVSLLERSGHSINPSVRRVLTQV